MFRSKPSLVTIGGSELGMAKRFKSKHWAELGQSEGEHWHRLQSNPDTNDVIRANHGNTSSTFDMFNGAFFGIFHKN